MRTWMVGMLFVISTTLAEPEATVQWLMKDPITMFDWGIESINRQLSDDLGAHPEKWWRKPWHLAAEYDSLTNRIYIVSRFDMRNMSKTQFRTWCEAAFSNIRALLRVNKRGVATVYERHFAHQGFKRADRPHDLAERLSEITILIARGDEGDTAHICEARLKPESIAYRSEDASDD